MTWSAPHSLAQAALTALNHVLRQQVWARDRLRAHVGRSICMVVEAPWGPLTATALIDQEGCLEAGQVAEPTVTLTVRPTLDALFAALRDGPRGMAGTLKVDGDVMLAAAVGELAQHLRWDIEEDLSRVVGDPLAHRAGQAARAAAQQLESLKYRLETGAREYVVTDAQILIGRAALAQSARALHELEGRLARLEQRVSRPQ